MSAVDYNDEATLAYRVGRVELEVEKKADAHDLQSVVDELKNIRVLLLGTTLSVWATILAGLVIK